MGFQARFESLSVHYRCQFAQQTVPESGSGVQKRSLSYLDLNTLASDLNTLASNLNTLASDLNTC